MPQALGNEIAKDCCPEKYYCKRSLYQDIIPIIIAAVIVAFFSNTLLDSAGLAWYWNLLIEFLFVALLGIAFYMIYSGIKKRLSQTYLCICEKGISGVCAISGYKNEKFSVRYEDITGASYQGDTAIIETKKGKFTFVLENAPKMVELIYKKANI